MNTLIRITLTNGKPTHNGKNVLLRTIQTAILTGKGEGGTVLMYKKHLKYEDDENTENNQ